MSNERNNSATVRQFLKEQRNGVLSTISHSIEQFPYGSVCPYMMDHEGRPVFLISDIAEHTKNITANNKVCLTVMDEGKNPRLEGARVSYMGRAEKLGSGREEMVGRRYLRFFPEAQGYFQTHGFYFYRIVPKRIRYIEGFGKIYWVEADSLIVPATPLIEAEERILAHVNQDHPDVLIRYCRYYFNEECESAQMIAVDSEGFTMRAPSADFYLPFARKCENADEVRGEMVRMAKESAG